MHVDRIFADDANDAGRQPDFALRTSAPLAAIASAMSCVPTEPYSLPSSPALPKSSRRRRSVLRRGPALRPASCATRSSSARRSSNTARFSFDGANRFAFRNQEIAREAALTRLRHRGAELDDTFQQNNVHVGLLGSAVRVGVRQQRQIARALDRLCQLALIPRLVPVMRLGTILPVSAMYCLQQFEILVVDLFDASAVRRQNFLRRN